MKILHNIGSTDVPKARGNYNTRRQVERQLERSAEKLSFDGVYENVWKNRSILEGRGCVFFVMGDYIGKDNSFDKGMPLEQYCTMEQLEDFIKEGHTIGWHTWSHPDLTQISLEEARKEMTAPFPCDDFAYPYGTFNEDLMKVAEELGYKRAWSVTQGNDNPYSLYRSYI